LFRHRQKVRALAGTLPQKTEFISGLSSWTFMVIIIIIMLPGAGVVAKIIAGKAVALAPLADGSEHNPGLLPIRYKIYLKVRDTNLA
jgi:hypothetical protein